MKENELYADENGSIWKVLRVYNKPAVLLEYVLSKDLQLVETIEEFNKRKPKKLN